MSETMTLPSTPDSVPRARRFVREAVAAAGAPAAADDAETLVSELATNAVLHARTDYTIEVLRRDELVRIRVLDRSGVLPRQRRYGPESTTGRGIRLIASIAAHWGVDPDDDAGKAVWFELRADGGRAAATAGRNRDDQDVDVDALLAGFDDDDITGGGGATAWKAAA
jgi:anti-sigma regulatory factor (Ser/Thr protein kinase)